MHIVGSVRPNVLGRRFPDDESMYPAVDLDVVFEVRSDLLAVLEPLHLLTVFGQLTLEGHVHSDLVQFLVLQLTREPQFFHCNRVNTDD